MMTALPEPMLARSRRLPDEDGYAYEPKWDGFRAIVRCGAEFRVRSRRGWNMTPLLPELEALPVDAVLDGELVALREDGFPHFPLVCARMLNGDTRVALTYIVFDVLELEGRRTTNLPYVERRRLLKSFQLENRHWRTSPSFDDGKAVFAAACECGLEGVVAKRLRSAYRPGERGWLKIKNRDYWRYPLEHEAIRARGRSAAWR